MLEYAFETIAANRGVFVGKTLGHQEVIRRRGAEGGRYAGWLPTKQVSGGMMELELIFERETEAQG